jgi:ferritin-like metal-binding protein YciE
MDTLAELLEDELRDIYSFENRLIKILPAMAGQATLGPLKAAFLSHVQETQNQIRRLDEVGRELDIKLTIKSGRVLEGLLDGSDEALREDSRSAIDADLFGLAQRIGEHKLTSYDTARAMAEALEHTKAATLLQQAFDQEAAAGRRLAEIADNEALGAALEFASMAVE